MRESGSSTATPPGPTPAGGGATRDVRGWAPGVLPALQQHVFTHPSKLSSGVLVGVTGAGDARVEAIIPTLAGRRLSTTPLERSHWGYVHETLTNVYPGFEVVGWYVARPGLRARVTEADVAIHGQFFKDSQHFLLAIDPSDGTAAAYVSVDGGVTQLFSGLVLAHGRQPGDGPGRPAAPRFKYALYGGIVGAVIWLLSGAGAGPLG